eukprot:211062-Pelagomonas_calceolata.AAC.1
MRTYAQKPSKVHTAITESLYIILIGVARTVYNPYTIDPLCNLGLKKEKKNYVGRGNSPYIN